MRAFNIFPGRTTTTGDLGTAPNLIAPGKRPLSSMTPTIIAQNGHVKLIVGSPGSQAIPQTVLSVMLGVIDFNEPLSTAVSSPRFSHQWLPDQITFDFLQGSPVAGTPEQAFAARPSPVPVQPVVLRAIAQASGGRFSQLKDVDVTSIYRALGSRVGRQNKTVEVTAVAAGGGMALMLAGALLSGLWFRRLP